MKFAGVYVRNGHFALSLDFAHWEEQRLQVKILDY